MPGANPEGRYAWFEGFPLIGGTLKSNASDYLELVEAVYIDGCNKCIADVFDLRDLKTIRSRVKHEGMSFLTITLPQFGSDFEKSLATGIIDSTCFPSFRKYGSIPALLRGMISQVFDYKTGRIYEKLCEDASTIVETIRQVCLLFKKVEIECSLKRTTQTLAKFRNLEQSLTTFSVSEEERDKFCRVSSCLWDNLFVGQFKTRTDYPKHGPGATAEGVSGNLKFRWQFWHDRLEPFFPLVDSGYPLGIPIDSPELEQVTIVSVDNEQPVRVVCVPKTLKSPRIIAIEPCCNQYAQQELRQLIYKLVEHDWMSAGHVNFTDQSVNQRLAVSASFDGRLATIDLSDASDRVPRDLAMEMFRSDPDLYGAIDACRSTRAELPDGTIIGPLKKFASMGSALCFPIEAMYFYTICVMALLEANNLPVTFQNAYQVSRDVHVYGDDLIVPSTHAMIVLEYLQKYNCEVNTKKTFCTGKFRESCGIDAYSGYPVTPVYIRKERPRNKRQADGIISWTASANLFYKKGYWKAATLMYSYIERIVGPLPYVSEESSGLGRISYLGYRSTGRWNKKLQRLEVRALVPRPAYRTDELEGYGALMKSLQMLNARNCAFIPEEAVSRHNLTGVFDPGQNVDAQHLSRSVRRGAVALKLRWLPVQ